MAIQRQISLYVAFFCLCAQLRCQAFTPSSHDMTSAEVANSRSSSYSLSQSALKAESEGGGVGGLFGSLFGGGGQQGQQGGGTTTIIDLPASTVKIGALRFFLQIYLVGEQNKPTQGSWVLSNNEPESLQMYYKDGTGMFSVDLKEYGIQIVRHGQRPSLEYALQESVMLHGVLDELNAIAFETDDIDVEKRLLQFPDTEAISKARESLPARKDD